MAMTTRLPANLHAEATDYAATLGLSLNALLAVALREYLDARRPRRSAPSAAPSPRPASHADLAPAVTRDQAKPLPAQLAIKAPPRRSDPCPCGARNDDGYPIKWKHCHGRDSAL
jgi:hypothetical protein